MERRAFRVPGFLVLLLFLAARGRAGHLTRST